MLTRRSILHAVAGVAVVAPLAGSLARAAGRPVPRTLVHERTATGTAGPEATFPVTHLVLPPGTAVRTRERTGWTPWRDTDGCGAAHDSRPGRSTVVGVAGTRGYEVARRAGAPSVLELNTVDGPARAGAAPAATLPAPAWRRRAAALPRPPYLSRAAWGADEAYRLDPDGSLDSPPEFHPVQTLTVHHTGFDDDQPDPAATVRAIYYAQAVRNDWGDIGYQLMIDAAGRVYEGTWTDPGPMPVFGPAKGPGGLPLGVTGAHVKGFNTGNVGVCLIGDFTSRPPSDAAVRSLTQVLAMLAAACRLAPTGTTAYANPANGYTASIATIPGHRDWHAATPLVLPTACPGDRAHPLLPGVREAVRAALTAP